LLVLLCSLLILLIPGTAALSAPADFAAIENASQFSDINTDSPLFPHVRYLTSREIIKGYPDNTFRPGESVTRAQMAVVALKVKGLSPASGQSQTFSDVPAGHWAYGAIEAAAGAGLLKGYPDGTFGPDSTVTRAEAVTIILGLSGGSLTEKNVAIADVAAGHWAYRQVATAVESGLASLPGDRLFNPEAAFRRGDLARAISKAYTIGPSLRSADLTGNIIVKKGTVEIISDQGTVTRVSESIKVGSGTKIITYADSQAELIFDDGSGFLIEPETELTITESRGINYMRSNGTRGVMIDRLKVELARGKVFGTLASRNEKKAQPSVSKNTLPGPMLASASHFLPAYRDIAVAGPDSQEAVPWWDQPYQARERVVVDMPWGIAGIRGTFWSNLVTDQHSTTSIITGDATVTSGGVTVSISPGQSSSVTSAAAPPAPPAPMSLQEQQSWQQAQQWVQERAAEIQNNLPPAPAPAILPPQVPVENPVPQEQQQVDQPQDQDIVSTITQALSQATSGVPSPPSPSNHSSSSSSSDSTAPSVVKSSPAEGVKLKIDKKGELILGETTAYFDGEPEVMDMAPVMLNDRFFVTPKFLARKLDLGVIWDEVNQRITFYRDNTSVAIFINDSTMYIYRDSDPEEKIMDVSPFVQNGIPFVPVKHVAEAFGHLVVETRNRLYGNHITVLFSEVIQPGGSFTGISVKGPDSIAVEANSRIDGQVIIIDPVNPLNYGQTYTVSIPQGAIRDSAGNSLAAPYSFSLTTIPGSTGSVWTFGEPLHVHYPEEQKVEMMVIDPDSNHNSAQIEYLSANVKSDTDPAGITVQLAEEDIDSDTFTGSFKIGGSTADDSDIIGALTGDTIVITYQDAIDEKGAINESRTTEIFVTALAQNPAFSDTDSRTGKIEGALTWESAQNESIALTHYVVHYLNGDNYIIGPEIAVVEAGYPTYTLTIPYDTVIPEGALKFGVFSRNEGYNTLYKSAVAAIIPINDMESAQLAFIPNYNANTVSIINTGSNTVIDTVSAGSGPWGAAVNPSANEVAVGNLLGGNLTVINTGDLSTTYPSLMGNPKGIAYNPDGSKIYVALYNSNTIADLDGYSFSPIIVTTDPYVSGPYGIDVSPDGSRLFVTSPDMNNVSVIDAVYNSVITTVNVGTSPYGIAVSPVMPKAYVANNGSDNMSVIDITSNTFLGNYPVGDGPNGIAVSPDGTRVYITLSNENAVRVIDTAMNTNEGYIPLVDGIAPEGLSFTENGELLYVINSGSDNVSVIDTNTNNVIATIPVGDSPGGLGKFIK